MTFSFFLKLLVKRTAFIFGKRFCCRQNQIEKSKAKMIERKIVKRLNPDKKEEQKIMKVSKKVPIVKPKLNKARRLIFGIKKIVKQMPKKVATMKKKIDNAIKTL